MAARTRYYDAPNNRLVYVDQKATESYWDAHWSSQNLERFAQHPPRHRWLVGVTKSYLKPGARILEGGCGLGDKVRSLHLAGFDAIGVDYAEDTVAWTNKTWPDAKSVTGDVRDLQFEDASFDGYWSLGVIEHFYDGYEPILSEMARVVKPGGYVFCTFPAMNHKRQKLARNDTYRPWESADPSIDNFYQFALDPDSVAKAFDAQGFDVVRRRGVGTLTGWSEESEGVRKLTKALSKAPLGLVSKINVIVDPLLGDTYGHVYLLICRRRSASS